MEHDFEVNTFIRRYIEGQYIEVPINIKYIMVCVRDNCFQDHWEPRIVETSLWDLFHLEIPIVSQLAFNHWLSLPEEERFK